MFACQLAGSGYARSARTGFSVSTSPRRSSSAS